MKITTVADVLRIVKERGFTVHVDPGPPPMPRLHGRVEQATPALLAALKAWRSEIIEALLKGESHAT